MEKISEYKTAWASSVSDLDKAVNSLIQQGYQPFGSPYLNNREIGGLGDSSYLLFQAVIKHDAIQ